MDLGRGAAAPGADLHGGARGAARLSGSGTPPGPRLAISAGLLGAFLLGRGRPQGLELMEATPEGAWRSFLAAAICLPAFLALQFFSWGMSGLPGGGLGRSLVAELAGYVTAWAGFALISLAVARSWDRGGHWLRFICAWNWTSVVQYLVLLALMVPGGLGLPGWLSQGLVLAGLGYAIWLEWFVVRHALAVEGWRAASLVAVDLFIALAVGRLVQDLSRGVG